MLKNKDKKNNEPENQPDDASQPEDIEKRNRGKF